MSVSRHFTSHPGSLAARFAFIGNLVSGRFIVLLYAEPATNHYNGDMKLPLALIRGPTMDTLAARGANRRNLSARSIVQMSRGSMPSGSLDFRPPIENPPL